MTEMYHKTVTQITALLDKHDVNYKCFTHEAARTSEETAAIRPEYSIAQGETVRGTVARGCLLFLKLANKKSGNLNSLCKRQKHIYV